MLVAAFLVLSVAPVRMMRSFVNLVARMGPLVSLLDTRNSLGFGLSSFRIPNSFSSMFSLPAGFKFLFVTAKMNPLIGLKTMAAKVP
jgi:hypothetical protein